MQRTLRRVTWSTVGLVALIAGIDTIERYGANRRHEEFIRRTGHIREGMTEAEVRGAAGVPNDIVTARESDFSTRSCLKAGGSAALLYSHNDQGWLGERLGVASGGSTFVVCLDASRVVISTYMVFWEI
jgi:hypothetical protein